MSAREDILGRIGKALGRPVEDDLPGLNDQPQVVSERLSAARRSTLPKVADELLEVLIANMESVLMSVARVQTRDDCVSAVGEYLRSQFIDGERSGVVTIAPALADLSWPVEFGQGSASGNEQVSVTPCIAAVAETGSVVLASGIDTPANLNFLPDTHIILVHEDQVLRHVDDVFGLLREYEIMPRAVNLVTGPSRTADIEQSLEIGVHGPRRMHVLLIESPSA